MLNSDGKIVQVKSNYLENVSAPPSRSASFVNRGTFADDLVVDKSFMGSPSNGSPFGYTPAVVQPSLSTAAIPYGGSVKHDVRIPRRVSLSWEDVAIKIERNLLVDKMLCRRKEDEVILENVRGLVEPGEMLALLGPRYAHVI